MSKTVHLSTISKLLLPLSAALLSSYAHSQALPAAGSVGKDSQSSVPARAQAPAITAPTTSSAAPAASSSAPLPVKAYSFEGNTAYDAATLQGVMELPPGNVSFAQLEAAADKISRHYRASGYLVARAYLPAQTSSDGTIKIAIIEGQYSSAKVNNTSPVSNDRISATANAALCADAAGCQGKNGLITDTAVERAIRLVNDIPGVAAVGELQPGAAVGSSNLAITAKPNGLPTKSAGLDNYGNRYTGVYRLNVGADFNNLNGDGAQLSLAGATTGKHQTSGSASYSQLIGYQGLRVGVNLVRSQYLLGDAFTVLDAHGTGTALGGYAAYPLIRHRDRNLIARGSIDIKSMIDKVGLEGAALEYSKRAYLYSIGLTGDLVDTAGGYNSIMLGLNGGDLQLRNDDTRKLYDKSQSSGNYHKLSYSLARQQAIAGPVTAYVALSGQTSYKNLDGSEKMGLGGPFAVRAYPSGEGAGDRGIVGNFELRYTQLVLGNATLTYSGFIDRGWSQANINPWQGAGTPTRALGGYGVGVLLNQPGGFGVRLMVAKHGTQGENDSKVEPGSTSRAWLQLSKAF